MKKGKKLLVLSTLLGIAIGAGGIIEYHDATQKVHNKEIMAYKQDATNILDNVYTKDGKKLLPIIYTQSNKNITRNKIISDFKAKGLTIKNTVPENIGTGTQIITDKATYEVVIYGDINGDGNVDTFDAQLALLNFVYGGEYKLTGSKEIAGNVLNSDTQVDSFDAQRILLFFIGENNNLVLNPPASDAEQNAITKVELASAPTKKVYNYGEALKLDGAKIKVTKVSGQVQTIPVTSSMVSGYNPTKVGEQTITVTYAGKKVTFKVTVKAQEDVITEIAVKTKPSKLNYVYGEAIDTKGGVLTVTYKSGKTENVNMSNSMITNYIPTKLGVQTVTVTYQGKTTTFDVNVEDAVAKIEIVAEPTKLTYKVGDSIDTTGGTIKVTWKSNKTETKNIEKEMIEGYDSKKVGEQTVTVKYEGATATFKVTVEELQQEDYIKKFEIITNPKKLEYVIGEDISLDGMVVKITRVSGEETELDLGSLTISTDINNPHTQNTKVSADTKTVTVSYKANNEAGVMTTFDATFEITVVKPVENIKVTKGTTTGHMYDTLTAVATVESGEGEQHITVDNLEWIVKDNKGNIIKDSAGTVINNQIEVTLSAVQFENKVAMNFRALREGTYILVPKVGTVEGQGVEITIDANNPIVTRIGLGAIENENKFRIGQTRDVDVEFIHEYEANVERTIQVEARRMTIEINGKVATNGTDYDLLDETGRIINLSTNPNAYVAKIRLIGTTVGQKTINVYVDKGESGKEAKATKTTTVLAEAKVFVKIAEADKSIKLYTTMPGSIGDNEILEQYNGNIYTLVRVWLEDEDGNITKITSDNISSLKTDTNKVQLIDTKYDAGTLPMALVTYKLYKGTKGNITPTEPDEGADYIGITMVNNAAELLRNERIIIRYGASSEEINIDIPRSAISTIKVTNRTTRGDCLQTIQIGTVKSGTNEMPITPETLEWEVQDEQGNVIKNSNGTITSNIVNVQVVQAQMAETVAIEFTAQEKGTYKVIPKVGTVIGTAIEVTIEESPIVTRIGLGDIDGKLRVGKRKEFNIEFFHRYAENDERGIEVEANRITIEINGVVAVAGTDYELMEYDEVNQINKIINVANDPTAKVEKIQLIGTTVGEKVINIYVDKGTENEKMATKTVTVEEQVQPTLTTDAETIKFYTTMPDSGALGENEKVELGTDGTTPYTLIKVWLDADGEETNITRADVANGTVEVKFSFQGTMEMPFQLEAYKEVDGVISKAEGEEDVTYLGIALFTGGSGVIQDNDKCMLNYKGNTIKEITIKK